MTTWTDDENGGTVWSEDEAAGTALGAATGSSLVGFVQSGSGPITESVQDALRRMVFSGQYSTTPNFNTARDALTDTAGVYKLAIKTGNGMTGGQSAEATGTSWLEYSLPSSAAPFQIHQNSAENTGAGAGTYNHAWWQGYNIQRHSAVGSATSNKPSLIMGMEDNYFDTGDSTYGSEWYVEYFSPNGTSVQLFRPFYARIFNADNTKHGAIIYNNIGTDGTGSYRILAGIATALLTVTSTNITFGLPTTFNAAVVMGTSGSDSETKLLISGTAKGLRLGTQSGAAIISGVDTTGGASYQPLILNGSTLSLNIGGGATAVSINASSNITMSGVIAVGGASVSTTTALNTPAGATGVSSLRIPHGSAPSSPVNGDVWTTTAGLFVRINGSTVGPLS